MGILQVCIAIVNKYSVYFVHAYYILSLSNNYGLLIYLQVNVVVGILTLLFSRVEKLL